MKPLKILSPSQDSLPTMTESEKALHEFRHSCSIWLKYMTPEDRAKAIAFANSEAEKWPGQDKGIT